MALGKANFTLLRENHHFRNFLIAKALVTAAVQMNYVAIGWQIFQLTNDPMALGFSGLAEVVPAVLMALVGGYISDRMNRLKIINASVSILAIVALCLVFISLDLFKQNVVTLYVLIAITGFARGFWSPANFALMAQLVKKEHYAQSAAWNSTFWQFSAVMGPVVGGLITGYLGLTAAYIAVLALLLLALLFFSFIKANYTPSPLLQTESVFTSVKAGLGFVFNNKIMLGAITLDLVAVLFGGATALLPAFAKDVFYIGAQGLGVLRAAPGIGALLMAIYLTAYPPKKQAGQKLLLAVAAYSATIILFAIAQNVWFALGMLLLGGMFDSVSVVIRHTILQMQTPDSMRGRVSSVNSIFINSSNELGAFESGLAASYMGLAPSVIFGGGVALVSVLFVGANFKQLAQSNLET